MARPRRADPRLACAATVLRNLVLGRERNTHYIRVLTIRFLYGTGLVASRTVSFSANHERPCPCVPALPCPTVPFHSTFCGKTRSPSKSAASPMRPKAASWSREGRSRYAREEGGLGPWR